jgi:isopenicillin N synthase-like dioxygenase
MAIPTLDLSLYISGTEFERRKLAADLLHSFTKHGFVKFINHGISDKEVSKFFESVCLDPIVAIETGR